MRFITAVIASVAVMAGTAQAWIPRNLTASQTINLMAGVVNGVMHEDHIEYFMGCVNASESMIGDIEDMVLHFSCPTFWGITEGLEDIKRFVVDDLPTAIVDCGNVPRDFVKFYDFFSVFGNSTLLTQRISYNFLWYYSQIMTHFNQAGTEWDAGNFYNCGSMLGEALVDAVGDHSQSSDYQNIVRRAIENSKRKEPIPDKVQQVLTLVNLMK
jgi:hypothetical protein